MRIRTLVSSVLALGMALGTFNLSADASQPWHFTGRVGAADLDSDRNTDDDDVWLSIGFGRFFGNNISIDIEYDEFTGDFRDFNTAVPGATFEDWKLSHWGVMGRYHFTDWKMRPFIGLGLGNQKHRNVLDEGNEFTYNLALGLQGKLSKHWSGNAQVLFRRDHDDNSLRPIDDFTDMYFSIGLSFDFGGKAAPPPPAPEAPRRAPPPPPNPDLDGDGVINERDKCPNTRPGAVVDLDGCEVEAVIELEGVNFDFDKATLRPEAKVILNEAAALLQTHERVVVEVAGHTDSIGTESYNQGLSERRAKAVLEYLVEKDVKASRLKARGYGESMPVASNDTNEGRAENRRVELIVLER
ncbi:MAG: OmpA family protein [Xanthomonadales bacterium]|nr:OmpA family protein [Xanthomonadales bacterium]